MTKENTSAKKGSGQKKVVGKAMGQSNILSFFSSAGKDKKTISRTTPENGVLKEAIKNTNQSTPPSSRTNEQILGLLDGPAPTTAQKNPKVRKSFTPVSTLSTTSTFSPGSNIDTPGSITVKNTVVENAKVTMETKHSDKENKLEQEEEEGDDDWVIGERRSKKKIKYIFSSDEDDEPDKAKEQTYHEDDSMDGEYIPNKEDKAAAEAEEEEETKMISDFEVEEDNTTNEDQEMTHQSPARPNTDLSRFSQGSGSIRKIQSPSLGSNSKRPSAANHYSFPKRLKPTSSDLEEPATGKDVRYNWLVDMRDAEGRPVGDPDYDPTTLLVPKRALDKFTPFERQYWEVKSQHWDSIVFFRKGKFYELYEKDADIGSKEFDLKMTDRVNMRMVGVPEKTFTMWAAKFIGLGYKVARVDETESQLEKSMRERGSKGKSERSIIERKLTTVLTAGTLSGDMVVDEAATYTMSIKEDPTTRHFGVIFVDASTGEFSIAEFTDDDNYTMFETLLVQIKPRELVLEKKGLSTTVFRIIKNSLNNPILNWMDYPSAHDATYQLDLESYFSDVAKADNRKLRGRESWPAGLREYDEDDDVMISMGAMVNYLCTLKIAHALLSHCNFRKYDPLKHGHCLIIDGQTLQNLDILQNGNGGSEGTLMHLLCHCQTAFGRRLFRKWICHPLRSAEEINDRLDSGEDLIKRLPIADIGLDRLPDMERLVSRVHSGSIGIMDLLSLLKSFKKVQACIAGLADVTPNLKSKRLRKLCTLTSQGGLFPDLSDELCEIEDYFDWKEAANGNIIVKHGKDTEVDEAQDRAAQLEEELNAVLLEAKKRFSNVTYRHIGNEKYQLEVSASANVPTNWILKSQTKSQKRYWTPNHRQLVVSMAEAEVTLKHTRNRAYSKVLSKFDEHYERWSLAVRCMAELDCLASLALAGTNFGEPVCRPEFVESDTPVMDLKEFRYPCLSEGSSTSYIPNDTKLGGEDGSSVMLLTGPNMGGKSTLLRQTCLAVIMAQLGCLVPGESCRLTPIDRIFTRIGANDNILAGQSTFMVELKETSNILKHSTKNSLVILDELGRGTSTFDGYAIAYAVVKHLIEDVGCLTFFATHYHMLCSEFSTNPKVHLAHMSCVTNESRREVTFLYKLANGVCPKSYGMNVASMAGVPAEVVDSAEKKADEFLKSGAGSNLPTEILQFQSVMRAGNKADHQSFLQAISAAIS